MCDTAVTNVVKIAGVTVPPPVGCRLVNQPLYTSYLGIEAGTELRALQRVPPWERRSVNLPSARNALK